jgi:hypothetical protein
MPFHKQMAKQRRPLRTKALTTQLTDTGQQLNATNADFLIIDVETALTFTQLALETDNQEKKCAIAKTHGKPTTQSFTFGTT